jgi:hypothetical protein
MTDSTTLTTLLDRVSDRTTAAEVRPAAIDAIRALEAKLATAGSIRGMHNLGSRDVPIVGMRVRSQMPDQRLPFDGSKHLILADTGALQIVKIVCTSANGAQSGQAEWHAVCFSASDEELQVEDVEHLIRTASIALTRHLAAVEGPSARFDALRVLAHKLIDIL